MELDTTAQRAPMTLPKYLTEGNTKNFEKERIRFLLNLAALYATPEGNLTALSARLGKSPMYFFTFYNPSSDRKLSAELAFQIEKLCDGVVTRKDFCPDLFS